MDKPKGCFAYLNKSGRSGLPHWIGKFLTHYRQTGVAVERLSMLLQGAPPERLVEHLPVYLRGEIPVPTQPARTEADTLYELTAAGLTCRYAGSAGLWT